MATIRNLAPRMVAFDVPALGSQTHHGATNDLDPQTGLRGIRPHSKDLPLSLTLAACSNQRAPLHEAISLGEAVEGLPDEAIDDPAVAERVRRNELWAEKEPPVLVSGGILVEGAEQTLKGSLASTHPETPHPEGDL
jgi:hypothetical protein